MKNPKRADGVPPPQNAVKYRLITTENHFGLLTYCLLYLLLCSVSRPSYSQIWLLSMEKVASYNIKKLLLFITCFCCSLFSQLCNYSHCSLRLCAMCFTVFCKLLNQHVSWGEFNNLFKLSLKQWVMPQKAILPKGVLGGGIQKEIIRKRNYLQTAAMFQ